MNELELLNKEYDDTQEALADLARVVGIDPERWDNDACPNNSDMVKEIIAELQKPWRPIEEAPKDGTGLLFMTKEGIVVEGCWDSGFSMWQWNYLDIATHDLGCQTIEVEATHWMPLPAPPTGIDL